LLRRVARPRRRIDGHLARTDALPATDENRKGRDSDQKRRGSNHPPRPGSRHRPFEEDHEIAPYLLLVGPHPHSRGPQALPKLAGPRPQTERMLRLSWEPVKISA